MSREHSEAGRGGVGQQTQQQVGRQRAHGDQRVQEPEGGRAQQAGVRPEHVAVDLTANIQVLRSSSISSRFIL